MATQHKWQTIPDNVLRHIWRCNGCGAEAQISPDWYEENGTPVCCTCDIDMEYLRTEIQDPFAATPELLEVCEKMLAYALTPSLRKEATVAIAKAQGKP